MKNRFFVMLKSQCGERLIPLLNEDGIVCQFPSRSSAFSAAMSTPFGSAFGFIIFDAENEGNHYC